jgi:molybdate/tungstate transport system ATP-binding protein
MIALEHVAVHAGAFALEDVSLTVPTGEYGVLMGRTGSGKTTLLETVAGLRKAAGGRIRLNGRDVTRLGPAARNVGYVPQDAALFTTMSVRDQLAFALEIRRVRREIVNRRVGELAAALGIAHLLHRKPNGLSGGERQRVALGRALAFGPSVLLLDEPLSALDEETRGDMSGLLRSIVEDASVTVLHVTHNPAEADALADCRFRIEDNHIVTA